MNKFILLLLEKVCEAIYFALFIIYGKNIKEKRLLFIGIMIFEYLIFKSVIHYNVWFQILYTFMSFVNLKVLYKDKAQITDIFLFASASVVLILLSAACGMFQIFLNINYYVLLFINRLLLFLILYLFKSKLNYLYTKYYRNWNRNNRIKCKRIKSLTLRNISIIIFNLMFYFINIGLIFAIITMK